MDTTAKGDVLENKVFDYFRKQIECEKLPWKSEFCRIFQKKGYFSRDRDGPIVFDVAIEFYLPGAPDFSQVWLFECKNYGSSVPVNDVEEFFAKVEQVAPANGKAILVSNSSFQAGGLKFAKNKRMGVMRFVGADAIKWELFRSQSANSAGSCDSEMDMIAAGMTADTFRNSVFDLYLQGPDGFTNSLWDYALGLFADVILTGAERAGVRNRRQSAVAQVPFITLHEIEERSLQQLRQIKYAGGTVSLADICTLEKKRSGLVVKLEEPWEWSEAAPPLGRISFAPLGITLYAQIVPNLPRERFTLAHELAHHLMSHGDFMSGEWCEEDDFMLHGSVPLAKDIVRMEYQANVFAACLLMPRLPFIGDFRRVTEWLRIPNRGYGELYLDDQPCNFQNFCKVTGELMERYGVSRAAVSIRLESLGLLRDDRTNSSIR